MTLLIEERSRPRRRRRYERPELSSTVSVRGRSLQRQAPIAVGERAERGSDRIGDGVLARVADGQRGRAGAGDGAYRGVGVIER
jgi:hypothetical protein